MRKVILENRKGVTMVKLISNKDLVLENIPNPEGESFDYHEVWEKFALTMNAYEVCGDSESAFELKRQVLADPLNASLTELRCALFVLQRHHRWNSPYSDSADKNIVHLLKLIRGKVRDSEID